MANNPYVNKVVYGGQTLIDISDTTATADKILQGFTAYGADGSKLTGTATGGGTGGNVWQDAQGYVHLDDEGTTPIIVEPLSVTQNGTYTATTGHAYSPVTVNVSGGGGLEYETGTFTPTEDTHTYDVSFANSHSGMPFYALVMLASGEYDATLNARVVTSYVNWETLFGITEYSSSSTQYYGYAYYRYRSTSTSGTGAGNTTVNYPEDNTGTSSGTYPRYWVSETGIKAQAGNSYYWHAGKTYKWIAVWPPTA